MSETGVASELSISGELSSNLSQGAAVRGVGEEEEAAVEEEGSSNSSRQQANPEEEQLADGDSKTASASAKVVLSEGPFSESETDQSEKDKENVSSGENKSETEAGDENERQPVAGPSAPQILQVRLQSKV